MPGRFLTVVAGPNGSGKTTLTDKLRADGFDLGHYINPDEIALTLTGTPEAVTRQAQDIAEQERQRLLHERQSMTFETVMSHESKIAFMRQAAECGYSVSLYFVATVNPVINIERVKARTLLGGHDVPTDKIISRYRRTLMLLMDAVLASCRGALFVNTAPVRSDDKLAPRPLRMVVHYELRDETLEYRIRTAAVPSWVEAFFIEKLAATGKKIIRL